METKRCSKCGEEKPVDQFWKDRHTKDGLRSSCKKCLTNTHREWQRVNRERVNAYNLEWRRERRRRAEERSTESIKRPTKAACYLAKARRLLRGEVVDPHCEVEE